VSVVVPTLNEAGSLAWVLERLPRWVDEVVLVDGLSTDETEVIARGLMADLVVVHQPLPGKGAAVRAGFAAATSDVIVMIDGDGSTNPAEIDLCVSALSQGADFVKGSRYLKGGGSEDLSRLRSAGNLGFTHLVNLAYRTRFTDLCYGYCAFWRRHLDTLALTACGFEIETQLILSAVKAGLTIQEVPSFELARRAGKSNLNAYRDGRRVLRTIWEELPPLAARKGKPEHRIDLMPAQLPHPGSAGWMPAGSDRRRHDRRRASREEAGYAGPERRNRDRRAESTHTVTVYRALPEPSDVAACTRRNVIADAAG
jgi:glycosyltransferase involved in cell wall biosynthesis